MAKIQSGILSPPIGKVGGVVGFKWKDKACLRGYVIPRYSNTDLQEAQRILFRLAAKFASGFLGQVIQPYMDKFVRNMSGYNDCIQYNIPYLDPPDDLMSSTKITRGNLYPLQTVASVLTQGRTIMAWTWTDQLGSNGKLTDPVVAVAYDQTTKLCYFSVELTTRATKAVTITVPAPLIPTTWIGYIFCAQYANEILDKVSDSVVTLEV